MRVMVLVKATEDSEKGFLPTTDALDALEAMGRYNEELVNAGIMRVADVLIPNEIAHHSDFKSPAIPK